MQQLRDRQRGQPSAASPISAKRSAATHRLAPSNDRAEAVEQPLLNPEDADLGDDPERPQQPIAVLL